MRHLVAHSDTRFLIRTFISYRYHGDPFVRASNETGWTKTAKTQMFDQQIVISLKQKKIGIYTLSIGTNFDDLE